MTALLKLQDFASTNEGDRADEPAESLPGYSAGFMAGQRAAENTAAQLDASLIQALDDLAFGFTEARQAVLQSLTPLFSAIIAHILPTTAEESAYAHLINHLQTAAVHDVGQPIRLTLNPHQVGPVQAILDAKDYPDFRCVADPSQTTNTVKVRMGEVETLLDIKALQDGISTNLKALIEISKREEKHG